MKLASGLEPGSTPISSLFRRLGAVRKLFVFPLRIDRARGQQLSGFSGGSACIDWSFPKSYVLCFTYYPILLMSAVDMWQMIQKEGIDWHGF